MSIVYDKWGIQVHHGDCLNIIRTMPDASVSAVITDPPAGIGFMGRDWDENRGGRTKWVGWLTDRMTEAHRVLKPGGHALVWALPRTSHWTALALENAGFEIRDCVVHLYGSGFPKSLDVSKTIDKVAGAQRQVLGLDHNSRTVHAVQLMPVKAQSGRLMDSRSQLPPLLRLKLHRGKAGEQHSSHRPSTGGCAGNISHPQDIPTWKAAQLVALLHMDIPGWELEPDELSDRLRTAEAEARQLRRALRTIRGVLNVADPEVAL